MADLADEPFAQSEIARLGDLRVVALEQLFEARLALGRHADVVGQLETLIGEHPYREGLRAQLMLALYRCDRQADALQAYQDARRTLIEELGIEPGERLRELERAILVQDPLLAVPAQEPAELPPELGAGTLLAGRDAELDWLREHWRLARGGAGRLVLVTGETGMGKTRLAAELAVEVQRDRGEVLYVAGAGPPDTARTSLEGVRDARRPTLLVLDDVDRAGVELRAALRELVDGLAGLPVLVVATAADPALAPAPGADALLVLGPLEADAVHAVARLYAGAVDDVEIPVERLAAASGGVPRRVHRAAGEWARREAARHLGLAADRAASERTGLRAAEDDVAGDVARLQAVRERAALEDGGREVVACPFKGLASYDVADAELFFGRERLVAEMVARLAGAPLIGIVGSSGSGKSSALRAGLLAALAAGVLPGSEDWQLALLRPGEHPVRALERATAEATAGSRLVVAVDQFEELFTSCRDEAERAAFVDELVAQARDPARRALVLVAVRADFYGRCAAYPGLSRLIGADHVLVGPMRRDELRRAIESPARRAGLTVDADVVDALIADVEGEPGGLPLLSTALVELWQRRDGRRLRMSAYEQTGGVHGAIARLAESAYARLEPAQREIARRILLRLAGQGEGESAVRRRVELAELDTERDERVAEVLAVLADDRLVTIGRGRGRDRARGAAARVAAPAPLARAGHRRPPPASAPARRRPRMGHGRTRPRRALPRRPPGGGRGVVGRPRARAQRDRARVPKRQPCVGGALPAPPARRARGRRGAARTVGDRRRRGARAARRSAPTGARGRRSTARRARPRRGRPGPLVAAGASGRRARRHGPDARQPARRAAQEPGRAGHAARRRRDHDHRAQPQRAHARRRHQHQQDLPVRHAHPAAPGHARG